MGITNLSPARVGGNGRTFADAADGYLAHGGYRLHSAENAYT
jgi:hypothetical protein